MRELKSNIAVSKQSFGIICFLAFLSLGIVQGCGSMAVDRLLAAAEQGLQAAKQNDELLTSELKKQIELQIADINKSFEQDVDLVASGQLKNSDGTAVVLDAKWVKEARVGYYLLLNQKFKQLQNLESIHRGIVANIDQVHTLLKQASDTNMAHRTSLRQTSALLEQWQKHSLKTVNSEKPE